jgi:predicted MFS family arabinose efflux permease
MRRQRSAVHAPFGGTCGARRGHRLFRSSFAGGLGLLDLLQPKQHLIFGQGLRPSAKPMALQFLDDLKKPIVPCPFGDQHRLQQARIVRKRIDDPQATQIPTLLRNYGRFLAHRACLGYALINCFTFAGMFSYISGSSFVFIEVFGVPSHIYGILFGVTALAFMAGASLNGRLLRRRLPNTVLRGGVAIVLLGGAATLALAIVAPSVPGVLLSIMIYFFGMAFVFPNANASAMEPMPRMAGVVSSLLGSSQIAAGSLAGYLVNSFYDRTPLAMASGIAGAALLAGVSYLLLIHRSGPPVQRAS